jgi:hypothetical protein
LSGVLSPFVVPKRTVWLRLELSWLVIVIFPIMYKGEYNSPAKKINQPSIHQVCLYPISLMLKFTVNDEDKSPLNHYNQP